jgi:hypothetical protein
MKLGLVLEQVSNQFFTCQPDPFAKKPLLGRDTQVRLMVAGVLALLSAGIFLAHAVAAYRTE